MAKSKRTWTQSQRLETIREALASSGEVAIKDLARKFKVSDMTIRRDLEVLERRGEIIRTHGGAASARRFTFEFTFRDKQNRMLAEKIAIAQRAAEQVQDGQVVALDTGTTTLEIARRLVDKRDVTVITTSLAIVSVLQFAEELEVVLLGGYLRPSSPDLHGPLTEQNLDAFRADLAFLGADAVDQKGVTYTHDLRVVNLDHKMADNASKVIVVADHSKLGATAMCKILRPSQYDCLITDEGVSPAMARALKRAGVSLEVATR